jgi:phosphonate transport system substrate-binding protein
MKRVFQVVLMMALALALSNVAAQDWKKKYPKLVFSMITSENESDRIKRVQGFLAYMKKELGVEIEFHVAADYAGVIEGMKAGKVHFALFGPKSYVEAYVVSNGNVEAFAVQMDKKGSTGYNSVFFVKADSPIKTIDQLKGTSFCFADPNSTSGYLVPSFYLRKMGYVPDQFFSKNGFSGSHENSVIAVLNGTYDAGATFYTDENNGNIAIMADKGMIKKSDIRIIWKSPVIPESPMAYLKDLPAELKEKIRKAIFNFHTNDPKAFDEFVAGKMMKFIETKHDRYLDILDMRNEEIEMKKSQG